MATADLPIRPNDLDAEEFLVSLSQYNPEAALRFASAWGDTTQVSIDVSHIAWDFIEDHMNDVSFTRCNKCDWPVFSDLAHNNCEAREIEFEVDTEGCYECNSLDRCDCEGVTIGEVRSRARRAGFRGDALREAVSQFPGDFV